MKTVMLLISVALWLQAQTFTNTFHREASLCTFSSEIAYLITELVEGMNDDVKDSGYPEFECNNMNQGQLPVNSVFVSGRQYYAFETYSKGADNYTCGTYYKINLTQYVDCNYRCKEECPEGQSQHPSTCACYAPCEYDCQELQVQAQQECDEQDSLLTNYECDPDICLLQYQCKSIETLDTVDAALSGSGTTIDFSGSSEMCLSGNDSVGGGYSYTETSASNCYAHIGSTSGNTVIDRAYHDGVTCYLESRELKTCSYGMVDKNCECTNNKNCSLNCVEALIKAETDCANVNALANISCSEELCQISNEGCTLCKAGEAVHFNNTLNHYECIEDSTANPNNDDENQTTSNNPTNNPDPTDDNTSNWLSSVNDSINNQSKDIVTGFNKANQSLSGIKKQSEKINSTLSQMENTHTGTNRRLDALLGKHDSTNQRLLQILAENSKTNDLLSHQDQKNSNSETNTSEIINAINSLLTAQGISDQLSQTNFDNLSNKADSIGESLGTLGQNLSKEISSLGDLFIPKEGFEAEIDTNVSGGILDDVLGQGADLLNLSTLTDTFNQFSTAYENMNAQITDIIDQFASVKSTVEEGFVFENLPSATVTTCVLEKTLELGELSWKVDMDFCKITSANYSMFYFMFYIMFFIAFLKMTLSLFMRLL